MTNGRLVWLFCSSFWDGCLQATHTMYRLIVPPDMCWFISLLSNIDRILSESWRRIKTVGKRKERKRKTRQFFRFLTPHHQRFIGTHESSMRLVASDWSKWRTGLTYGYVSQARRSNSRRSWTVWVSRDSLGTGEWLTSSCALQMWLGILLAQRIPLTQMPMSIQPHPAHDWFGIWV